MKRRKVGAVDVVILSFADAGPDRTRIVPSLRIASHTLPCRFSLTTDKARKLFQKRCEA